MDSSPHEPAGAEPPSDLTLREAAEQYAVSARTLAQHIHCGQLRRTRRPASPAASGGVTRDALDGRRLPAPHSAGPDGPEHALVAELRPELAASRRAAAAERRGAEDADRRLAPRMLECGRLRAALAAASEGASTQVDLTSDEARWLVDAVRGASPEQRRR